MFNTSGAHRTGRVQKLRERYEASVRNSCSCVLVGAGNDAVYPTDRWTLKEDLNCAECYELSYYFC